MSNVLEKCAKPNLAEKEVAICSRLLLRGRYCGAPLLVKTAIVARFPSLAVAQVSALWFNNTCEFQRCAELNWHEHSFKTVGPRKELKKIENH